MQALIFDCDGVLVDTERDGHRVAFNKAFAAKGLSENWSVERYHDLLLTAGGKERMKRHFDETEWPVPAQEREDFIQHLHRLKTDIFMELIQQGKLPLRPGISRIMNEAIDEGVTLAVCSTSNERAVQAIVDKLLGDRVAAVTTVFAGDMVKAKKPDPAIYLMALDQLRLDRTKCIVVEDSNIGLTAARAAGIRCLVTKSSYTGNEDFSAAQAIVSDLDNDDGQPVSLSTLRALLD
ncbi:MAG: HAD-IA family hydrolase [Hyphomicrobiales bacterium]